MTDKDWKKELTDEEYRVMRNAGTEAPFSSKYNAFIEDGNYTCKGCGTFLFSSESKFDGHCGWPSFDQEIEDGIIDKIKDSTHGMIRTEIVCSKCKTHLGHIFDDGPTDTGMRYCVNGISLNFSNAKEEDWFENWFDSKYYPLLYQKRNINEAEKFISNLLNFIEPKKMASILDLACGEGRHSNFLSSKGFQTTGIDLSSRSIDIAIENKTNDVHFEIGDMRKFSLGKKFDYVFNLFTSFGYFQNTDDNLEVLDRVSEHLNEGGLLIIDFLNKYQVIKNLVHQEVKTVKGITFNISREATNGFVVKKINFKADGKDNNYQERVQLFHKDDFEKLLELKGFEIQNTFGDYDLNKFEAENSPRLVIIAKKM